MSPFFLVLCADIAHITRVLSFLGRDPSNLRFYRPSDLPSPVHVPPTFRFRRSLHRLPISSPLVDTCAGGFGTEWEQICVEPYAVGPQKPKSQEHVKVSAAAQRAYSSFMHSPTGRSSTGPAVKRRAT